MKVTLCSKCNSDKIVPNASVRCRAESGKTWVLRVVRRPDAIIFTKAIESEVVAQVCGECGYTEFYAEEPQALYSAYKESLQ